MMASFGNCYQSQLFGAFHQLGRRDARKTCPSGHTTTPHYNEEHPVSVVGRGVFFILKITFQDHNHNMKCATW